MPEPWYLAYERDILATPSPAQREHPLPVVEVTKPVSGFSGPPSFMTPVEPELTPEGLEEWTRVWRMPTRRTLAREIAAGVWEMAVGVWQGVTDFLWGRR